MASSPLNQKSNFHARSNSLPSRPHPLVTQIDEYLCRLKSNESASSSSPPLTRNLSGLRDLYELVDDLLQLPVIQQSLAQRCNDKQVNELLNESLKLLDVCGVAKDVLLQAKEDTQQLQSILRRRRGTEAGFTNETKEYFASRKKAKKLIRKSLKACKCGFAQLENDGEATFSMLREVERVTFTVFESLYSYIFGSKMESKSTNWSLVSKWMSSKRVTCEGEATETNEFEKVDAVLCTVIGNKIGKSGKMSSDDAQIELQKLESSIQDLEDGVECLLRLLIKTRVSVLNILSQEAFT
ncbi:putative serine/threonine-protein kinase [Hibiscus syriacus]|uniref:Serine/threonine-protein kinase n=1 Tax=Hibiscus syriacus TaxID=106335 RepID=A0A6A3BQE6_HIBSY|nr:uncharacterized protein LOC120211299 [Hibiscus syriacus]KAE8719156.1 putative serine/threonine-protein kinase [Hibiscus syriacus]